MPQKQNPVRASLVNAAALQAPQLGAQLHVCAGQAVDQRPAGAWHAEWPSLRRLLRLTVVAAGQAADLIADLQVDSGAMSRRARAASEPLLSESGGGAGDPSAYLGANDAFVEAALTRFRGGRGDA